MYYNNHKVLGHGQGSNGVWRLQYDQANPGNYRVYQSDGFGRDTYCSYSNGGFIRNSCNAFPVTGTHVGQGPSPGGRFKIQQAGRASPCIFYQPDGSGRDTYVGLNHGGFVHKFDYHDTNARFAKGLRQHKSIVLKNNRAISQEPMLSQKMRESSNKSFKSNKFQGQEQWFNQKDHLREQFESMNQREQSDRLSAPKKILKKWDDLKTDFEEERSKSPSFKRVPKTALGGKRGTVGRSHLTFDKRSSLLESPGSSKQINLLSRALETDYLQMPNGMNSTTNIEKVYNQDKMLIKKHRTKRDDLKVQNGVRKFSQNQKQREMIKANDNNNLKIKKLKLQMKILESQRTQASSQINSQISSKYGYFGHQKLLPVNFSNKHISEAQIQREADMEFRVRVNKEYKKLSSQQSRPKSIQLSVKDPISFLDADFNQNETFDQQNPNIF